MDFIGLVKDDWEKIPNNLRYLIVTGVSLLILVWTTDHWGKNYTFLGWHFQSTFFSLGIALILIGFALVVLKQFFSYSLLVHYRDIYAPDKLNINYSLVLFKGRMILFDKRNPKNKEAYHVETSQTALDLGFWGSEYPVEVSYQDAVQTGLDIGDPIGVKVSEYKYMGAINTRR